LISLIRHAVGVTPSPKGEGKRKKKIFEPGPTIFFLRLDFLSGRKLRPLFITPDDSINGMIF